ncbi:unnamed protein product, partial [Prorocentrum cordatum]
EKDVAWVKYGVRGAPLWHQRLILARLRCFQGECVVLTPDGDVYIEDLQPYRNPDIVAVAWETVPGRAPIEIGDENTYNFGAFPQGRQWERLLDEADGVANAEERRRGPVVHPPGGDGGGDLGAGPMPPPIVDAGAAGEVRGTLTPRGREREVRAPAAPEGRWVIAVANGSLGFAVGDEVAMSSDALVSPDGRMGLVPAPRSAEWVFVERLRTDETPADYVAAKVAVKVQQVEFKDWPMPGPRTVLWCVQFVDRRGGGPIDHHRWWVAHLKLSNTDFGVQEHEHGMRAFQFFGEYDQIDLPNLVGLEVVLRRCQVIEFHYEKKNKGGKANEQAQGVTRDEAAYFSGSHRLGGEVMICPELVEGVSKEIGRDVEASEHRPDWESDVARALNELGGYQDTPASEPVGGGTDTASPAQFRLKVLAMGWTHALNWDLCAPICTRVLATDASAWGLGVTETVGLEADVKHAMSFSEAWRFKEGGEGAREQARERIEEAKVTGQKAESANVPEGVDVCARLERGVDLVPRSLVAGPWRTVRRTLLMLPRGEGYCRRPPSPGVELATLPRAPTSAGLHGAAAQPLPWLPREALAHTGRAPELARLSYLQAASVRPRTQQLYLESWQSFEDWARCRLLPLQSEKQVDDALVGFFDYQYFEGAHSSLGSRLVSATCYFNPQWGRQRGSHLAAARQAFRGWALKCPSMSRLPTPWEVVCLLCDWLVRNDRWSMAVAVLMCVVFYLRPSEALSLRRCQLVPPLPSGGKHHSRWAVILHPMELGQPSKVNKWGDSRPLDLPDHNFMVPLLEALWRQATGPDAPLFEFTYQQWRNEYRKGGLALGLQDLGPPTLYGLRHAGASLDISLGRRSPLGVQHRGGWAQPSSMRRYQKAGRLTEQLHYLPHGAQLAAAKCASEIGAIMSRSDYEPLGLPDLSAVDREKVRIGNVLMTFS